MKILQLDVNKIEYEAVKPEASVYEPDDKKRHVVSDALVLLVSFEKGDNSELARKAVDDAVAFAKKQKLTRMVIYPFAHLSGNLEGLEKSKALLEEMRSLVPKDGIELHSAPFGWNKQLSIDIKGHPLAEMSRSYSSGEQKQQEPQQKPEQRRKVDLSIVKKADWSGLPDKDHRSIGEAMDLYSFQEVSPAMVYWHPNGHIIYRELVRMMREKEEDYGYREISTPALANIALWHVSGHIDHYKGDMFIFEDKFGELGLKPMNCPSTILIYKSRKRSYKELPMRLSIFDKLYRSERSGTVTGLFRVKELTQDDAHIFITEEQLQSEVTNYLKMLVETYEVFGLKYNANLSTMPDDHMGDEALWERATNALRQALEERKIPYGVKEKDGAFYGPKIDFDITDSAGRLWQCGTLQLDYQLPLRFKLEYTGEDGKQHSPIILHRTVIGSIERFTGIMVEHFQGRFPTWLAPLQVKIIPISEKQLKYGEKIYRELKKHRFRAELDSSDRTLEYKIRDAQMLQVPYSIIVGGKEEEALAISVRSRDGKQRQGMKLEQFVDALSLEIGKRDKELGITK